MNEKEETTEQGFSKRRRAYVKLIPTITDGELAKKEVKKLRKKVKSLKKELEMANERADFYAAGYDIKQQQVTGFRNVIAERSSYEYAQRVESEITAKILERLSEREEHMLFCGMSLEEIAQRSALERGFLPDGATSIRAEELAREIVERMKWTENR